MKRYAEVLHVPHVAALIAAGCAAAGAPVAVARRRTFGPAAPA